VDWAMDLRENGRNRNVREKRKEIFRRMEGWEKNKVKKL
jgi:hypothetical protein